MYVLGSFAALASKVKERKGCDLRICSEIQTDRQNEMQMNKIRAIKKY